MRIFAAQWCIVGALLLPALPARAQADSARDSGINESIAQQPESTAKSKSAAPPETETNTSPDKTAPHDQPIKADSPDSSVEAFVARLDSATRAIHEKSKSDPDYVRHGCRDFLDQILDIDAMVKGLDTALWDKMTPPQRDTFRAAFEHRMIGRCVKQIGGYEGQILHLLGVRATDGGILLVTVRIGAQEDGKQVTWRVRNVGSEHMRAIDVITEGRSMIGDTRVEFAAVLESMNGDIGALIEFLQK